MPIGPFDEIPVTRPPQKVRLEDINEMRRALTNIQDAYDVAVANGFTGTRGQWLDSLKGEPGDLTQAAADTRYYRAPVVDGLLGAEVAGINARHPAWPLTSGARISAITHGAGLRRDTLTSISMSANQLRSSLLYLPTEATFDQIGLTIGTGDGNVRLGVGSYDFASRTATLISDFGALDVSTAGDKTIAINETLGPGWIILLAWFSAAPTVAGGEPVSGYSQNSSGNPVATPVRTGGTYGALPSTIVFNTDSTSILSMWLEVA